MGRTIADEGSIHGQVGYVRSDSLRTKARRTLLVLHVERDRQREHVVGSAQPHEVLFGGHEREFPASCLGAQSREIGGAERVMVGKSAGGHDLGAAFPNRLERLSGRPMPAKARTHGREPRRRTSGAD